MLLTDPPPKRIGPMAASMPQSKAGECHTTEGRRTLMAAVACLNPRMAERFLSLAHQSLNSVDKRVASEVKEAQRVRMRICERGISQIMIWVQAGCGRVLWPGGQAGQARLASWASQWD